MTIEVRSNEPTPKPAQKTETPATAKVEDKAQETKSAHEEISEQKQSEESETTETEANEVTEPDHEDHVDESEKDKANESEIDDKPKKKGGFQKRIDKLNARVTEKERELEYWKQEALKKPNANPAQKVEANLKSTDGKPEPAKFDSHSDYVEALTDWKIDQKAKDRETKQAQDKVKSEHENVLKTYQDRVKAFSEKTKDFNDVLAEADDIQVSPTVQQLIVESEHGPEILYELAKNREEVERLNKLSPLSAAREMGKIESRFSSNSSDKKVETKKITNAPKPLETVGGGGKGSTPKSIFDSNLSQSDYEAIRREQLKRRRA
jgi:hypothetical protein